MLAAADLFTLELKVRTHAESLRKAAEAFRTSEGPDVQLHAGFLTREADEFDQVGNLLVGLQGNWTVLGPMVRAGYAAVMAEFEKRKVAAADPRSEDVAA